KQQPVLRAGKVEADDFDWMTFCRAFKLNSAKRSFDLTTDKLDPFLAGAPAKGVELLDLETRSLFQVLFFVSHGVDVPRADLAPGIAPVTNGFNWDEVLGGLFKVYSCAGKKPPVNAHVAICYQGHWFYIDESDRDTKATFALL